jgi:predicted NAD/FAD-binding protein
MILSGYEFLHLRVVVAVVGLAIAGLAAAHIVPCLHNLRDF